MSWCIFERSSGIEEACVIMLARFFSRPAVCGRSSYSAHLSCAVLFQLQAAGSGGDVHPFEKPFFTAWESAAALCICLPIYWLGLLFSKRPDPTTDEEQPLLTHQVASGSTWIIWCASCTKTAVQACAGIATIRPVLIRHFLMMVYVADKDHTRGRSSL